MMVLFLVFHMNPLSIFAICLQFAGYAFSCILLLRLYHTSLQCMRFIIFIYIGLVNLDGSVGFYELLKTLQLFK